MQYLNAARTLPRHWCGKLKDWGSGGSSGDAHGLLTINLWAAHTARFQAESRSRAGATGKGLFCEVPAPSSVSTWPACVCGRASVQAMAD